MEKERKEFLEKMGKHGVFVLGGECPECILIESRRKTKLPPLQKLLELQEYTISDIARSTKRKIVCCYVIRRPYNEIVKRGKTTNFYRRVEDHVHNKQSSNLNYKIKTHPQWEQNIYSYKVCFIEVPEHLLDKIERYINKMVDEAT